MPSGGGVHSIDYSSPDRVIAASGRPDGEANADGNRNLPREIGAGLDIRVDARAERGDGGGLHRRRHEHCRPCAEPDGNVDGAASHASEETAEPGGTEQAHKTSR